MAKTSSAKKKDAPVISLRPAIAARRSRAIHGVVLGTLARVDAAGPRVIWPGAPREIAAVSTAPLRPSDVGRRVALAFEGGDPARPIVLGLLAEAASSVVVEADGEHVVVESARRITLRCGKASLTLTRSGKIVLRGAHVVSRSSGTNRVQGTVVEIN